MSRYLFDVHDDGPSEWGAGNLEDAGRDEIEHRARELIDDAQQRQHARAADAPLTTVFVHEDGNGVVLTAYGRPDQDVRLVWASIERLPRS